MKIYALETRKKLFEQERNRPNAEPTTYYLDAYLEHLEDAPILREAKARYQQWMQLPLAASKYDLIAGLFAEREVVRFHYGSGTDISEELAKKLCAEDASAERAIQLVRAHSYNRDDESRFTAEEWNAIRANAADSTFFLGHMVLDFETVLTEGLGAYFDRIDRYGAQQIRPEFYEAMRIQLQAVVDFIGRLAENTDGLENGAEIARNLNRIQRNPPETFWQALQLVWILHMLDSSDSFGRFDFYLDPFYQRDIRSGVLTESEARALLVDFMIKVEQVNSIQNMTIGGVDAAGNDFYTELTGLILDVTREVAFKGPNLCLRVTETMPPHIWNKALDSIKSGIGLPALYNDGVYIGNLVQSGIPPEEAWNYCLAGCSQVMIPGKCNFMNDIGLFNAAKIAELTLYDGFDPRTGVQVGPHTGAAADFQDFSELMDAFYKQLDYFCGLEVSIQNKEVQYVAKKEGYALRSLFMQGCLETARSVFEGGALYNNIELEVIGITNAADQLYAIKKGVFEERRMTLSKLCAALSRNWEGAEEERRYFKQLPKFGNDDEGVDTLRAEISRAIYERFNQEPAVLGGRFVPGEVIFISHIGCGAAVGATADGRKKGAPLADSAGAAGGNDQHGPTALLNSVLHIPVNQYLLTSVVTNLKFLPEVFKGEKGKQAAKDLLGAFFEQGGMQVQINVFQSADLRDAQRHPENYRNLIVRVGGYSDYFVNLSPELQTEIINRNGHAFA